MTVKTDQSALTRSSHQVPSLFTPNSFHVLNNSDHRFIMSSKISLYKVLDTSFLTVVFIFPSSCVPILWKKQHGILI